MTSRTTASTWIGPWVPGCLLPQTNKDFGGMELYPEVEVRASHRTAMSAEWAHLFGVEGTLAEYYSFNINCTEINLERRTVVFWHHSSLF